MSMSFASTITSGLSSIEFSNMDTLYISCVKSGGLSFISVTLIVSNAVEFRGIIPLSSAIIMRLYTSIASLSSV